MLGLRISPLPWHSKHDGDEVQLGDATGKFVAMTLPCESDGATQLDYNNALMIAHAVSNYDQMRTALAELIEAATACEIEHHAVREARIVMSRVRHEEDEVRQLARANS